MSKTKRLFLISDTGNCIEWGPGCLLGVSRVQDTDGFGVASMSGQAHLILGVFATEKQAVAVRALFLQAILAAPDGGLLRWDDERQQVVDELAEDEDDFAPMPAIAFLTDVPEDCIDSQSGPVTFAEALNLRPGCSCENPYTCTASKCEPRTRVELAVPGSAGGTVTLPRRSEENARR